MFEFVRAGGNAAAAGFALLASSIFSTPSLALEIGAMPVASTQTPNPDTVPSAFGPGAAAEIAVPATALGPGAAVQAVIPAPAAAPPQIAPERSLAELVSAYSGPVTADAEQECLAGAVYFEARGEPIEGQLAVAEVVLNRAASGRYPPRICDVVTQPWQFSFIRRGRF